jgi:hypothetical protein
MKTGPSNGWARAEQPSFGHCLCFWHIADVSRAGQCRLARATSTEAAYCVQESAANKEEAPGAIVLSGTHGKAGSHGAVLVEGVVVR